jgi:hypothetical protein
MPDEGALTRKEKGFYVRFVRSFEVRSCEKNIRIKIRYKSWRLSPAWRAIHIASRKSIDVEALGISNTIK